MENEIKTVESIWVEYIDVDYHFSIKCPYCYEKLGSDDLDFWDNEKINKQVKCIHCNKKFKLKVKEL